MWQLLERKIYFLHCLFVYFILLLFFCHPHFSFFFFLLFLLSAFFFVHPHFSIRIFPSASAIRRYPVRVLQTPSPICLSSKHKRRGYLFGVRNQIRVLSKYLFLCTCSYPFYSAYKSLIHRVNFSQLKLSTDIEKNLCRCYKNDSCSILSKKRCSIWGKCGTTMCCNELVLQAWP